MATQAAEWMSECFIAMEPGVDLRFIAAQFAAGVAKSAFDLISKNSNLHGACAGALAVIYARARGVIVQDEFAVAAVKALGVIDAAALEADIRRGHLKPQDIGAAILSAAVALNEEGPALAASYAASAKLYLYERHKKSTDESQMWEFFSCEIVHIIKSAREERLRIVDLNQLEKY
jgi:hypothetical protein